MEKFEVNILGCGSALPTAKHCLSSQVICLRKKLYMIDCGEGSQMQFRVMNLHFEQLNHIFISHLHGDHCLGLPGLISVLGLLKRTTDLHVYAETSAECLFAPFILFFCKELSFRVIFHPFDPIENVLIFEDEILKVSTIPLKHRVPTVGFLLEEKQQGPDVIKIKEEVVCPNRTFLKHKIERDSVISDYNFRTIAPDSHLADVARTPRKYAYCSDTAYYKKIIPLVEKVDLLYHESTFSHRDLMRAEETYHSSAKQAAFIAKAARVKKLILGHFSARYPDETFLLKEAQEVFVNAVLATDRMVLKI